MLEVANAELEEAKRSKETTEQDLKGYEVELAMNEATIQTLEALIESSMQSRISLTQDEISTVGSDLDALKVQQSLISFSTSHDLLFTSASWYQSNEPQAVTIQSQRADEKSSP
ncbi:hypothetical protein ACE6H2_028208 [Prunus campanulata]